MIIFADKKINTMLEILMLSMFVTYGLLIIFKILSKLGSSSTSSSNKPHYIEDYIHVEIRNEHFIMPGLYAHAYYHVSTQKYEAYVDGFGMKSYECITLDAASKEKLEDKIDKAYIQILNYYESRTGRDYVYFEDGVHYRWHKGVVLQRKKGDKEWVTKDNENVNGLTSISELQTEQVQKPGKKKKHKELIEITYSAIGYEGVGDTTFTTEVSSKFYEKLSEAEEHCGYLHSDDICDDYPSIHKFILAAIHKNMREEALDPDDGMIETRTNMGAVTEEYSYEASHEFMAVCAMDEDIEYEITLY